MSYPDKFQNELTVGDYVLIANHHTLKLCRVSKLLPKMIKVDCVDKITKYVGGSKTVIVKNMIIKSTSCSLLHEHDMLVYKLRSAKANVPKN